MHYTVIHGRESLQLAANQMVIPAHETASFANAIQCAQALSTLLSQERERIQSAAKTASQTGFSQGQAAGRAQATEAFGLALDHLDQQLQKQAQSAREAVSALALGVVYKLAASLGASNIVPALIEQATEELLPMQATRIRVSPDIFDSTLAHLQSSGSSLDLRADANLSGFECVIESAQGQSVVSLDAQLKAISTALHAEPVLDVHLG
jgi:flagellar biosynthesis/type III secretory pathway protein FliH